MVMLQGDILIIRHNHHCKVASVCPNIVIFDLRFCLNFAKSLNQEKISLKLKLNISKKNNIIKNYFYFKFCEIILVSNLYCFKKMSHFNCHVL